LERRLLTILAVSNFFIKHRDLLALLLILSLLGLSFICLILVLVQESLVLQLLLFFALLVVLDFSVQSFEVTTQMLHGDSKVLVALAQTNGFVLLLEIVDLASVVFVLKAALHSLK